LRTFFLCLLLASASLAQQAASPKELTIEQIYAPGGITGRAPEFVRWSPDGKRVAYVQRDDAGKHAQLFALDAATGKSAVLVSEEKMQSLVPPLASIKNQITRDEITRYGVAAYQWAPDSKHLLFNAHGQLWYYDLETGTATALATGASDPKFSRDGGRVSYLHGHDLYVQELGKRALRRLTRDGGADLLNGEVDWVYKEELDVRSNYFWSPGGGQIAFLQMNESGVPTYPITEFLGDHVTLENTRYPQAGDPNPAVRLGVVSTKGGKLRWIDLPGGDLYIPRFGWVRDGLLWAEVLNRAQNQLDLYFADAATGRVRLMLRETDPRWIDVNDDFQVLSPGDEFLWKSWRSGHSHLYLYQFSTDQPLASDALLVRALTSGDWEVSGVDTVDEAAGLVYFTANKDDPRQQQLYRVKLDGSGLERVSREPGTHTAAFAPTLRFYVDTWSALMTPPCMSLCDTTGACRQFWTSRDVAPFHLVAPQWVNFKAADGTTTLYGMLMLPPNASAETKVPLILNPYGGPQGQVVKDAWGGPNWLFDNYMAQHGFAILQVDNRGMGGRGRDFAAATQYRFGEVALADQLAALHQALAQFPVLDSSRVGFWGWSFGGYMTTYALTHSDAFKAGVAVAPVTNWRLYDSIYTERYMGLPQEHAEDYLRTSTTTSAGDLHGSLLIAHGTSDDNVHFQNTVQFVQALIKAGKSYDLQLYPGKTHSISGATDRDQLFHRIQEQFTRELMGK
jgi:dipeptidyl-peptidase-4